MTHFHSYDQHPTLATHAACACGFGVVKTALFRQWGWEAGKPLLATQQINAELKAEAMENTRFTREAAIAKATALRANAV